MRGNTSMPTMRGRNVRRVVEPRSVIRGRPLLTCSATTLSRGSGGRRVRDEKNRTPYKPPAYIPIASI